jgi:hypothetical protein
MIEHEKFYLDCEISSARKESSCQHKKGRFGIRVKSGHQLTADHILLSTTQKIAPRPKDTKLGSLKSLQRVLATISSEDEMWEMLSPLVGIYELRLGDAHLPFEKLVEAYKLAGIDPAASPLDQGCCLIENVVSTLRKIESKVRSTVATASALPPAEPLHHEGLRCKACSPTAEIRG